MSAYSGKCDFKDHIDICGLDDVLNSNIYIYKNHKMVQLDINKLEDCIPYYGHVISSSCSSKGSPSTIVLDRVPWIAREKQSINIDCYVHYRIQLNEELKKYGLPPKYSKEECTPGFFMNTKEFGPLMEEEVLSKYNHKLLTCKDSLGNLYLAYSKSYKPHYVLAKVEGKLLDDLFDKKMSVSDVFRNSKDVYIGDYKATSDSLELKKKNNPLKIGKIHLPKESLFYDYKEKRIDIK